MAFESVAAFADRVVNFVLFRHGTEEFTIGMLLMAFVGLGATFFVSRLTRRVLKRHVLTRARLDEGTQFVVLRAVHYFILAAGAAVILPTIGVNLTSLAVVAGVLGVGIGFGLQNITSNFVSGILLLFERPIKVGDYVTVGDTFGQVTGIAIRSTHIATADNVTIIIPNSDFITNHVTNWSYGDLKVRARIPVGVAYGSDTELVKELLLRAAREHSQVLTEPEPSVFFRSFGESSLNFELTAWAPNPETWADIRSDLHYTVDRLFREHGVEIPFPQRDVHVRSAVAVEKLLNPESS